MTDLHTIAFSEADLDRLFLCVEHTLKDVRHPLDRQALERLQSLVMRADAEPKKTTQDR